jgi:hypothetical protein
MFVIVIIRFNKYLVCKVTICLNKAEMEAFNTARDSKRVSFIMTQISSRRALGLV